MAKLDLKKLSFGSLNPVEGNDVTNSGDRRRTSTLSSLRAALNQTYGKDSLRGMNEFVGVVLGQRKTLYASYSKRQEVLNAYLKKNINSGVDTKGYAYKVYIPELEPRPVPCSSDDPILRTYQDVYWHKSGGGGINNGDVVSVRFENLENMSFPLIYRVLGHVDVKKFCAPGRASRNPTRTYSGVDTGTVGTAGATDPLASGAGESKDWDCAEPAIAEPGTEPCPDGMALVDDECVCPKMRGKSGRMYTPDHCSMDGIIQMVADAGGVLEYAKTHGIQLNMNEDNPYWQAWSWLSMHEDPAVIRNTGTHAGKMGGLSEFATAALIGGFRAESGKNLKTTARNSDSAATGIAQWLFERKEGLAQYYAEQHRTLNFDTDEQTQSWVPECTTKQTTWKNPLGISSLNMNPGYGDTSPLGMVEDSYMYGIPKQKCLTTFESAEYNQYRDGEVVATWPKTVLPDDLEFQLDYVLIELGIDFPSIYGTATTPHPHTPGQPGEEEAAPPEETTTTPQRKDTYVTRFGSEARTPTAAGQRLEKTKGIAYSGDWKLALHKAIQGAAQYERFNGYDIIKPPCDGIAYFKRTGDGREWGRRAAYAYVIYCYFSRGADLNDLIQDELLFGVSAQSDPLPAVPPVWYNDVCHGCLQEGDDISAPPDDLAADSSGPCFRREYPPYGNRAPIIDAYDAPWWDPDMAAVSLDLDQRVYPWHDQPGGPPGNGGGNDE